MSRRYRKWVEEYQNQAWTLALYLLKDVQEAEDACQEAFVKLWNHQDSIDKDKIRPRLMKVTRNGCLDRLRRDVTGNISKYIPFTEQSRKEKNT